MPLIPHDFEENRARRVQLPNKRKPVGRCVRTTTTTLAPRFTMKRSFLLLYATLLGMAAPLAPTPARANDAVPIDFFYDALSPYGDWISTPNYGYVWQPLVAQQPGWAPYADGSWAYTDAGWTWISNEDFGWITYHYGRWIQMQQGWMWVPGNDWAPAWVSWRQTQGQIGWAPLPPEAAWYPGTGFGGWTDGYYDVGPGYYNVVPMGAFASATSLLPCIMDRNRNFGFYGQSVNVTHMSYMPDVTNHIFVGGPDPQRINGFGGNQVRRLTLRRDDAGFRRDWLEHPGGGAGGINSGAPRGAGSRSRIEQDQLVVTSPSIRRGASQALPSRVRETLQQPQMERGWRGAADVPGAEHLRQQQRDELARTAPPSLPEKTSHPATSTAAPPAFGRTLLPHERQATGSGNTVATGTMPPPAEPRPVTEEIRQPTTPQQFLPAVSAPGIPNRPVEQPATRNGPMLDPGHPYRAPHAEGQTSGTQPAMRPSEPQAAPNASAVTFRPGIHPVPQHQERQVPQYMERPAPAPPPRVFPLPQQQHLQPMPVYRQPAAPPPHASAPPPHPAPPAGNPMERGRR